MMFDRADIIRPIDISPFCARYKKISGCSIPLWQSIRLFDILRERRVV